jgi:ankyrin repeat protein
MIEMSITTVEARDKSGNTPLLKVANSGDAIPVAILLDAGAYVNACNNAGRFLIHLAMYNKPAIHKYTDIIDLLVKNGAAL